MPVLDDMVLGASCLACLFNCSHEFVQEEVSHLSRPEICFLQWPEVMFKDPLPF